MICILSSVILQSTSYSGVMFCTVETLKLRSQQRIAYNGCMAAAQIITEALRHPEKISVWLVRVSQSSGMKEGLFTNFLQGSL